MANYPFYSIEALRDFKELIDRSSRLYGAKDAFREKVSKDTYRSVTYSEFSDDVHALGTALIARGFEGKNVGLIGENSYPWVLLYFSVVNINATIVPMDKDLSKEEITSFINRTEAEALFYSSAYVEVASFAAAGAVHEMQIYRLTASKNSASELDLLLEEGRQMVREGNDLYDHVTVDRERTSSILFTSGTTGVSKGVMLSQRNLLANTKQACELVQFTEQDDLLSVLPINHAYEDMCGLFGPMYYGAAICFCPWIKELPACLKLFRPTIMVLVPLFIETFYKKIWDGAKESGKVRKLRFGIALCDALAAAGIDVRDKLLAEVREALGGRLKIVISGGSYLESKYTKGFRQIGVTILQGYGITECSPIISANRNKHHKDKSVGRLASGCELKLDENGQILVRGANVMKGYWKDEQGTKEAFDGDWFKTGDLGGVDSENYLYFKGRCKDIIVLKNGKNVMPQEIEGLLLMHPLIKEVVVKDIPGENGAEALRAVIYPDPELSREMDPEQLTAAIQKEIDEVNKGLIYYKKIRTFTLRDTEFQKTTTRKIKRYTV